MERTNLSGPGSHTYHQKTTLIQSKDDSYRGKHTGTKPKQRSFGKSTISDAFKLVETESKSGFSASNRYGSYSQKSMNSSSWREDRIPEEDTKSVDSKSTEEHTPAVSTYKIGQPSWLSDSKSGKSETRQFGRIRFNPLFALDNERKDEDSKDSAEMGYESPLEKDVLKPKLAFSPDHPSLTKLKQARVQNPAAKAEEMPSPTDIAADFSPQKKPVSRTFPHAGGKIDSQTTEMPPSKDMDRLLSPSSVFNLFFPTGTRCPKQLTIVPVSSLMSGDTGHFISYGLIHHNAYFLFVNPPETDTTEYSNMHRIKDEISWYFHKSRLLNITSDNPHAQCRYLSNGNQHDTDSKDKAISDRYFLSPGQVTSKIAMAPDAVRAGFADIFNKLPSKVFSLIEAYLAEEGINPSSFEPKIFIWGRTSGLKGIHPENDTSDNQLKNIYSMLNAEPRLAALSPQFIFIGDPPIPLRGAEDREPLAFSNSISMFEFWKSENFSRLNTTISTRVSIPELPTMVLQTLLFYTLASSNKNRSGNTCIHISNRSGIGDKIAMSCPSDTTMVIELTPGSFDYERIQKIENIFIFIALSRTPSTPGGRIKQFALDRLPDIQTRYGIKDSELGSARIAINSPDKDSEKMIETLQRIRGTRAFKISQERFCEWLRSVNQSAKSETPNPRLVQDMTIDSIEQLKDQLLGYLNSKFESDA